MNSFWNWFYARWPSMKKVTLAAKPKTTSRPVLPAPVIAIRPRTVQLAAKMARLSVWSIAPALELRKPTPPTTPLSSAGQRIIPVVGKPTLN